MRRQSEGVTSFLDHHASEALLGLRQPSRHFALRTSLGAAAVVRGHSPGPLVALVLCLSQAHLEDAMLDSASIYRIAQ